MMLPTYLKCRPNAYVQKKGERGENPYDEPVVWTRGAGGIMGSFSKLNLGDRMYVSIEENGKKWRSEDLTAPAQTQLRMHSLRD